MTLRLYHVRHGQTVSDAQFPPDYSDRSTPLSSVGKQQVERMAKHLTTSNEVDKRTILRFLVSKEKRDQWGGWKYNFSEIMCSPQECDLQTAAPIADAFGLKMGVTGDLEFPEFGQEWEKARNFRLQLIGRFRESVLVVCNGDFINALLFAYLGITYSDNYQRAP